MPNRRKLKNVTSGSRTRRFGKKLFYLESVHKKRSTQKNKAEGFRKKGRSARAPRRKIQVQVGTSEKSKVKGYPVYSDNPF